jgi:FkbM family methyltransferase
MKIGQRTKALLERSRLYTKTLLTARDLKSFLKALLVKLEDELFVERLGWRRRIGAKKWNVVNFDVSFYCDNHTVSMYYEIFGAQAYTFFPSFVPRDGDFVVDVGANQGIFTCYAAKWTPRGWVYAVEPDTDNLAWLKAHLELNHISNATVIAKCVGDRTGRAYFRKGACSGTGCVVDATEAGPDIVEVDEVTLGELMVAHRLSRIDLLKIDAEGFEARVLSGAADSLESIRRIVLEYHSPMLADETQRILQGKGFRLLQNPGVVRSHILYFENSALCKGQ